MRRAAAVGSAVGASVVVLAVGASGAQRRPDSGIRGMVLYGPTCPVQRAGQTCERPYATSITVKREPAGTVVARASSGSDGRFTARLSAGTYLLEPRNGKPYPRAQSQTVTVHRHRFTNVTIRFDSGIR
jgi:hypothetical protein